MKRSELIDPSTVVALISETMARLATERGSTLSEAAKPVTETLADVLLREPALTFGLDSAGVDALASGRNELAAFVGFDFAMRCVAIVLGDPFVDHRAAFRSAALSSARILTTDDSALGE